MLLFLGVTVVLIISLEILRMTVPPFTRLFEFLFGKIIRDEEWNSITGASYSFLGAFIAILIFEKEVAVFAMLVLSLSDSTAALIGRKWGSKPLFGKSVQGTLAFLIMAIMIALIAPGVPRTEAVAAALFSTLVELFPSPVNDNLLIPLSTGIILSLMRLFT
ncbi:MAG: diacylglycerol/polyprenol kinase family protein [Fidelibacterota bacterium]